MAISTALILCPPDSRHSDSFDANSVFAGGSSIQCVKLNLFSHVYLVVELTRTGPILNLSCSL